MVSVSWLLRSSKSLHWLLISFDQWRSDWLDKPELQVPTLKHLSRRSIVARRCLTASPQCVPARASWLTGLWPSQLGITQNTSFSIPPSSPSFVRNLREQGYETALIGKTHWHPHAAGVDLREQHNLLEHLGFNYAEEIAGPRALAEVNCSLTDAWEAYESGLQERYRKDLKERYYGGDPWRVRPSILPNHLYPDIWVGEQSCAWLRKRGKSDKPWLLWVSFPGPHEPWDTPKPWAGIHKKIHMQQAVPRPNWIGKQPHNSECRKRQIQWRNSPSNEAVTALRADYADHLALLDEQVSNLMRCLPEPECTAITVVSDHGELLGDAGFLYKSCFLEGAVRSLAMHYRPDKWRYRRLWRNSVGLTWFLGAAAADVSGRCKLNKNSSPRLTISEFGEEILVSDTHKKLVMTRNGEPLWATDLQKDPAEQHNIIHEIHELEGSWKKLQNEGLKHLNLS